MKVTVQLSKVVKPAYCGSGGFSAAGATTAQVVPLTVFDKATFATHMSVIYGFRAPAPSNAVLEAGLARVLVEYREWAGRFGVDANGNSAIVLSDDGARFVEATADVTLDSVVPLKPGPELLSLHPSNDDAPELMLIQVTRFACGSLVVGFTTHHVVADGRATSNFFVAWSQATRGVPVDPAPVYDRASFFRPRDPPLVEFDHRHVEFKPYEAAHVDVVDSHGGDEEEVLMHKVHMSREFISKLKAKASAGAHRPYSTVQCLVAHLWRCMTTARGLDEHQATSLFIAVDGRARMDPQVPDGYTGNVVLWARPTATAGDLVTKPLQHTVEIIERAVNQINDAYFKSFIDFASSGVVEKERLVPTADAAEMVLTPNIEVDSWLRIPFWELDFGGGRPFFFMPSYLPAEGLIILLPSVFGDGSIDSYVALYSRDMDTFKSCCYSMD